MNVVYTGAVQIPICYGSVSVPLEMLHNSGAVGSSSEAFATPPINQRVTMLPSGGSSGVTNSSEASNQRYTHRRFVFIRDGSDLQMDAFYRWWWWNHPTRPSSQTTHFHRGQSRKRGRDRSENTEHTAGATNPTSPSLFYSLIDHVDFVVPRSFPHVRRSVFDPPFMIEDDAWADHMAEIHLYFRPELSIPPTVLLHPCSLQERPEALPSLRSMTDEQSVPATAGPTSGSVNMPHATGNARETVSHDKTLAMPEVSVCERKDTLRVFHPSTVLVDFLKDVRQHGSRLQKELISFLQFHYRAEPAAANWRLCFERDLEKNAERRFQRSRRILQGVVADLQEEQDALVERAATTMSRIFLECENIQCALTRLRNACLSNNG